MKLQVFSWEYVFSKEELQAAMKIFSTVGDPKGKKKPKEKNNKLEVNNEFLSGVGEKKKVRAAREMFLSENNSKEFDELLKVPCNTYGKVTRKSCSTKNWEKKKIFILDITNL